MGRLLHENDIIDEDNMSSDSDAKVPTQQSVKAYVDNNDSVSATLTNKRITPRVSTTASTTSWTINSDSYDSAQQTALAGSLTVNAPSGTPTNHQNLMIRIKDNGTTRAISWNSIFRAIGVTLPTATTANKTIYIGCRWNSSDSKWDVLAVGEA